MLQKTVKVNDFYPLYHSVFETFAAVKSFIDPTFSYHRSMAQMFTEMVRSLSDSEIIPFKTHNYALRLLEIFKHLEMQFGETLKINDFTNSMGERFL